MILKKILLILSFGLFFGCAGNIKKVTFDSHGKKLKGNLYLPSGYDGKSKKPAVVVTGSWTTVKEQMAKTYAQELTKKGFVTLIFDFRGWGESSGDERYLEDPTRKTQDIIEAVNFLSKRGEVDQDKIAGVGICASSGYMVKAFTETKKLKTIALVAPWLHNRRIVNKVYKGKKSVDRLIKIAKIAEKEFKKTGKLQTVTAASKTDKNALMYNYPYYTDENRGLIKEYDNKFNVASFKSWLTFDAISYARKIPGKILFVESESMDLPEGSRAFKKLARNKVKSVNLPKVNQFDFYDQKGPVSKSVESIASFLREVI